MCAGMVNGQSAVDFHMGQPASLRKCGECDIIPIASVGDFEVAVVTDLAGARVDWNPMPAVPDFNPGGRAVAGEAGDKAGGDMVEPAQGEDDMGGILGGAGASFHGFLGGIAGGEAGAAGKILAEHHTEVAGTVNVIADG